MKIEETFSVAVPPDVVYREANDVAGIGWCIAGVKEIEVLSEDESRWKLEVSAGFMTMGMDFDARIVERRAPEFVRFEAAGQNVTLAGHIAIAADGCGGSDCTVNIDAQPQGPLAPLVDQMGRGIQQQLARKTITNIRTRLSPDAGDAAASTPEPLAPNGPSRTVVIALAAVGALLVWLGWRMKRR